MDNQKEKEMKDFTSVASPTQGNVSHFTYKGNTCVTLSMRALFNAAKYMFSPESPGTSYLLRNKENNYYHPCSESVMELHLNSEEWVVVAKFKNGTLA